MSIAALDQLRKQRTTRVSVLVDDEPVEFVVAKIKVGQQRALSAECVDDNGQIDLDKLYCRIAQMCVVEPVLSDDVIDEIDGDVFAALSVLIANHSGVSDAAKLINAPDFEEGSGGVRGFPAANA